MKYILTILLLASCQSREVAGDQNATTIATQAGLIDGEANTIEAKFPKAKPHTDKIKESTPIIREANDAQQEEIIRLRAMVKKLQEKQNSIFKWFICGGLAIFGSITLYFSTASGGNGRTILGATFCGLSISFWNYYDIVANWGVPALIFSGVLAYVFYFKDKDDERIGKTVKPTVT